MFFSQNDKPSVFSSTNLPDSFITEYLTEAKGDYVKVYLYILFLSKYNKDIKLNDLSKSLSIDYPTCQEALNYWESKDLLIKKTDGYILADLQELELSKLYSPKVTSTPEVAIQNAESQLRAQTIDNINTQFFQGVMSPGWYNDIDLWFTKYGFDEQVMLALFSYAYDKRALHRNYIIATAEAWNSNNIKTFNDLELYFESQDKKNKINDTIAKKLNLHRKLTTYEQEDVSKWTNEFNYDMDIIEIALKKASSVNKINFDYINTLLTDWNSKELKTVDEVNTYLDSIKTKSSSKSKNSNKNQQVDFEFTQSSFDNLNSLFDN